MASCKGEPRAELRRRLASEIMVDRVRIANARPASLEGLLAKLRHVAGKAGRTGIYAEYRAALTDAIEWLDPPKPRRGQAPHSLELARLRRGAEHLHSLGPRAVAEFLAALGGRVGGTPACLSLLGEYGRLTPGQVRAAGGDKPLPCPLHVVPR